MLRKNLILICMLMLSLPSFASLDIYVSGNLDGQFRYTPEANWEALKQLVVNARIEGLSNNVKAVATFGGLGDPYVWQPITSGFPTFNFQVKRLTLSTQAPLYHGGNPATVSFGDVAINYSPLIVRRDDSVEVETVVYNPMVRGVSIKSLQLPVTFPQRTILKADAFMIWETNNEPLRMTRAIGKGTKLNAMLWGNEVDLVAVHRGDLSEEGRTIAKTNTSVLLGITRQSADNKLRFEYALDSDTEDNDDTTLRVNGTYQRFAYSHALGDGLEANFEYLVLAADFDPVYRDRTPRFNEEGKAIGWNPLDSTRFIFGLKDWQLYNQRQMIWGLNFREGNLSLVLNIDYRTLDGNGKAPDGTFRSGKFSWQAPAGKYLFDGRAKVQRITLFGSHQIRSNDLGWQLKLGVSRPLFENESNKISLNYRWYHEHINPEVFGSLHTILIHNKMKRGLLAGANTFAGIRQEKALFGSDPGQFVYVCGLDLKLKRGIELEVCWASKNRIEPSDKLYDYEGEEYIGYDNIFRLGISTAF